MHRLLAVTAFAFCLTSLSAAAAPEDTPKAAKTRELLKKKINLDWKDTSFGEVIDDLKMMVKGLRIHVETKTGVNLNKQITFKAKDIPLEEALDQLLGKNAWGFYVESQKGSSYDGDLYIRVGKERGWKGVEGKPKDK